jgi:predicted transposase YbfD/YdcC
METKDIQSLRYHLRHVKEVRIARRRLHSLEDILLLTIIAVICGCEGWEEIELFGKTRLAFLKGHLGLANGIPSHDTLRRVFMRIDPAPFECTFREWAAQCHLFQGQDIISLDGKTVRGSQNRAKGKNPIHIVSAFAGSSRLVLGQVKVDEKSNEITAIPDLLDQLDVEGDIITIDAMGCQREIAQKIIECKADYVLALKSNQAGLERQVIQSFELEKADEVAVSHDKGHGRIETRKCSVIRNLKWVEDMGLWPELKSIVKIESRREVCGKATEETRYFISSLDSSAARHMEVVRAHWGIENTVHWTLDVVFREDHTRKRTENSAQNFALVRKFALNILKADKSVKTGLNSKRLKAGWDPEYLLKILKL